MGRPAAARSSSWPPPLMPASMPTRSAQHWRTRPGRCRWSGRASASGSPPCDRARARRTTSARSWWPSWPRRRGLLHGVLLLPRCRAIIARNYFFASLTRLAEVSMQLQGIHHISAITGDARRNLDFYTRVLGLRLVAKTVNQDDPSVYHLFYADEQGHPGSEMTFFEYPHAIPGRPGAGMVHRIVWRVGSPAALDFWFERLGLLDVAVTRDEAAGSVRFSDPEGLDHELVVNASGDAPLAAEHPEIPQAHALQGFDGVRAYATDPAGRARCSSRSSVPRRPASTSGRCVATPAAAGLPTTPRPPSAAASRRQRPPRRLGYQRGRAPALAGALRGRRACRRAASSTARTSSPSTSASPPASSSRSPTTRLASPSTHPSRSSAARSSCRRSSSRDASCWKRG